MSTTEEAALELLMEEDKEESAGAWATLHGVQTRGEIGEGSPGSWGSTRDGRAPMEMQISLYLCCPSHEDNKTIFLVRSLPPSTRCVVRKLFLLPGAVLSIREC